MEDGKASAVQAPSLMPVLNRLGLSQLADCLVRAGFDSARKICDAGIDGLAEVVPRRDAALIAMECFSQGPAPGTPGSEPEEAQPCGAEQGGAVQAAAQITPAHPTNSAGGRPRSVDALGRSGTGQARGMRPAGARPVSDQGWAFHPRSLVPIGFHLVPKWYFIPGYVHPLCC